MWSSGPHSATPGKHGTAPTPRVAGLTPPGNAGPQWSGARTEQARGGHLDDKVGEWNGP